MPTLGRFIQRRRIELGLTQEQLAEIIGGGVRQSEISRLENDRIALPRRQRLEQIASALDVSLGQLLARSGWAGADSEFGPGVPAQHAEPQTLSASTALKSDAPPSGADVSSAGILTAALARAEDLIAASGEIVTKSQTAYGDARRAVRYSSAGRGKSAGPNSQ